MFQHKKFQAALLASLIALFGGYASGLAKANDFVLALTYVDWTNVIIPWLFAIAGQAAADLGKEKAKIEREVDSG